MTTITTAWLLASVWGSGFLVGAVVASGRRRPRGNGNCEPMPPAPPYLSTVIARQAEEAQRAIDTSARCRRAAELYAKFIDSSMGVPWDEGHTQRGNGSGGPTTPKPPIKPQPPRGRIIDASGMTIGYQPLHWPGPTTPPPREP